MSARSQEAGAARRSVARTLGLFDPQPADVVAAVADAETSDAAFDALGPDAAPETPPAEAAPASAGPAEPVTSRAPEATTPPPPPDDPELARLRAATAALDEPIAKGRAMVAAERTAGRPIPTTWVARLQELEAQRLAAAWALDDHRAARGVLSDAPAAPSYPTPLAARLIGAAFERTAEMAWWRHRTWPDVAAWRPDDDGYAADPRMAEAFDRIGEHAPGWSAENLKHQCQRYVALAVAAIVCGQEK